MIDLYCERVGPGLWAEPLNAFSNLVFLLAAFALWRLLRRDRLRRSPSSLVLIGLIATIGVGSFLFHVFAGPATLLADVIPIFLFQLTFLVVHSRRVLRLAGWKTAALLLLFFAASWGCASLPREWLNGSLSYGAALIFVLGFGIEHALSGRREPGLLLAAAALFALSLGFRSIDLAICDVFAVGSHFVWHLLNGAVLYLTTRAFVLNRR